MRKIAASTVVIPVLTGVVIDASSRFTRVRLNTGVVVIIDCMYRLHVGQTVQFRTLGLLDPDRVNAVAFLQVL